MIIELNKEQAETLVNIINIAVKARGLEIALQGSVLANMINEAHKKELSEKKN